MVNRGRRPAHAAALDQLPETANPLELENPLGGPETSALAKTRHRTLASMGRELPLTFRRDHRAPVEAFLRRTSWARAE